MSTALFHVRHRWLISLFWVVLVGFGVISRWLLKSHYLFHHDSVQFALALENFDIVKHQPHPPGYIAYLGLAKIVNAVVAEPNTAFIVLGIIATLVGMWAISWLATQMWGRVGGMIAAVLFVTNTSVWFHGLIAEVYIVEAVLALVVVVFAYRYSLTGRRWDVVGLGLLLGLLGGVRQVGEVLLLPLAGFVIWRQFSLRRQDWLWFGGALLVGNLAWLAPLLWLSGGVTAYWQALSGLWTNTVGYYYGLNRWLAPVKNASLLIQTVRQAAPASFLILSLSALAYIAKESRTKYQVNWTKVSFWGWAIIPSLILLPMVLVTNPGYGLFLVTMVVLFTAGAVLLLTQLVHRWQPKWAIATSTLAMLLLVGLQLNSLIATPVLGLSYATASLATVRNLDDGMDFFVGLVDNKTIAPSDTIILVNGDFILRGIRHFQYYLPDFDVYGYFDSPWEGVKLPDDKLIHTHGPALFASAHQAIVPGSVTKIIVMISSLDPRMDDYLSVWDFPGQPYSLFYFDLTKTDVRDFLTQTGLFQFSN